MRGWTWTRALLALVLAVALALTVAACGGNSDSGSGDTGGGGGSTAANTGPDTSVKGTVSMTGIWAGAEQASFKAVLAGFRERYPNVNVRYTSAGNQLPTVLSTAVQGGNPPDLAAVAQPGLVADFARRGKVKPITFAQSGISANYGQDWLKAGSVNGKLYGLFFKGANKSTVWFNPKVFADAGVQPAATWEDFLKNAETLKASGVPAYSIAGSDGWTLTDLFENIYLRQAGPEKYDQLAAHTIPWTDPSVVKALTTMKDVIGDRQNIAGGTSGALQVDFPTSVSQVFRANPAAAQVIEGDFVPTAFPAGSTLQPVTDYDVATFPSIDGSSENTVMGGGDQVVMFRDTPASRALITYLATPEAAEIWAKRGGFSSPNKSVDPAVYSDELTRKTATALAKAETFRFDLSDTQPASFGATVGQGEWKILQDFLRNPSDPQAIARRLESAAAAAYK